MNAGRPDAKQEAVRLDWNSGLSIAFVIPSLTLVLLCCMEDVQNWKLCINPWAVPVPHK